MASLASLPPITISPAVRSRCSARPVSSILGVLQFGRRPLRLLSADRHLTTYVCLAGSRQRANTHAGSGAIPRPDEICFYNITRGQPCPSKVPYHPRARAETTDD